MELKESPIQHLGVVRAPQELDSQSKESNLDPEGEKENPCLMVLQAFRVPQWILKTEEALLR
jgi:hypothetical protein